MYHLSSGTTPCNRHQGIQQLQGVLLHPPGSALSVRSGQLRWPRGDHHSAAQQLPGTQLGAEKVLVCQLEIMVVSDGNSYQQYLRLVMPKKSPVL